MLSIVLTVGLLLAIIEGTILTSARGDVCNKICADLIVEAKNRYMDAYKNVPGVCMSETFNEAIKQIKFIDGTFDFTDHYTFKHVVCDAVSKHKYTGNIKRSEAMFIMDFMMEAYHEIRPKYPKKVDINLNNIKEHV